MLLRLGRDDITIVLETADLGSITVSYDIPLHTPIIAQNDFSIQHKFSEAVKVSARLLACSSAERRETARRLTGGGRAPLQSRGARQPCSEPFGTVSS
jgi:hypothetical protein